MLCLKTCSSSKCLENGEECHLKREHGKYEKSYGWMNEWMNGRMADHLYFYPGMSFLSTCWFIASLAPKNIIRKLDILKRILGNLKRLVSK